MILFDKKLNNNFIEDFNTNFSISECGLYKTLFNPYSEELNGYEGCIESNIGHRMRFVFRPAKDINIARTIIILHGHGANKSYSKFYDENWNVIAPLDEFGENGLGSWWMGENGDYRTYYLLQNLILTLRNFFKFSSLYFWGSSMGGYGAIVHGFKLKAFAIYAHIPQTKLYGTDYTDGINSKFYHNILSNEENDFSDLTKFINKQKVKKSPVLFLSQNSGDKKNYINDHFFSFLKVVNEKGFAYSVNMPLKNGHTQHISVYETVKTIFEKNYRSIKNWRISNIY